MKKTSCLISLLLLSAVAQAQTTALLAECATSPPCKLLFDRAREQSASGHLADALHSYNLAYAVTPDPRLLYSIARVLHKQGQYAEAIPYYRQFLATPFTIPADEAQKTPAKEFLTQCEAAAPPPPPVQEPPITPPLPPPIVSEKKPVPVSKKWWFWTVIWGTATAVGVGVGVGVAAREPDLSGVTQYRPFAP